MALFRCGSGSASGAYEVFTDYDAYSTGNTTSHVYQYDELVEVYVLWNRDGGNVPTSGQNRFNMWLKLEGTIYTNYNSSLAYGDHLTVTVNETNKTFTVVTDNTSDAKGVIVAIGKNIRAAI